MDVCKTRCEPSEVLAWRRNQKSRQTLPSEALTTTARRKNQIRICQLATTNSTLMSTPPTPPTMPTTTHLRSDENQMASAICLEMINSERVAPLANNNKFGTLVNEEIPLPMMTHNDDQREANLLSTRSLSLAASMLVRRDDCRGATCCCSSSMAALTMQQIGRSRRRRRRATQSRNIGTSLLVVAALVIISFTFAVVDSAPELDKPVSSLLVEPHQQQQQQQQPQADNGQQAKDPASDDVFSKRQLDAGAQLSSAELPAEFRGAGGDELPSPPREQSRLAKLCQQTSSVLASVLPAPFGGHKRSILCQFFGQVNMPTGSGGATKLPVAVKSNGNKHYPIGGVSPLPAHLMNSAIMSEPESIAILQQHQQAPVAMLATGKHPIQLVLEHQQRQAQAGRSGGHPANLPLRSPVILNAQQFQQTMNQANQNLHDLKGQRGHAAATRQPIKFSAPLVVSPVAQQVQQPAILVSLESTSSPAGGSSPTSSTGWRIFNATLLTSSSAQQQHDAVNHSTSPMPSTEASTKSNDNKLEQLSNVASSSTTTSTTTTTTPMVTKQMPAYQRPKTVVVGSGESGGPHHLQIGKRTSESPATSTSTSTSTSTTTTTTTTTTTSSTPPPSRQSAKLSSDSSSSEMRTIEVMGQSASAPAAMIAILPVESVNKTAPLTVAGGQSKRSNETISPPDSRQNQKREELVIASINNLTRIAFGNQLRDTVKVINKLIDQQAGLFGAGAPGESQASKLKSNSNSGRQSAADPMQMSESISNQVAHVPTNSLAGRAEKPKSKSSHTSGGKFLLAKTRKLDAPQIGLRPNERDKGKASTGKQAEVVKPLERRKPISTNSSSDKVILNKGKPTTSTALRSTNKMSTKAANKLTNWSPSSSPPTRSPSRGSTTTTAKLSSSTTRSRGAQLRQSTTSTSVIAPTVELKRLTTVSRALTFNSDRLSSAKPAARIRGDDTWPLPPEVGDDLRTSSSVWMPSSGLPKVASEFATSTRHYETRTGPTVTQFPWLLPDKSAADLFASSSITSDTKTTPSNSSPINSVEPKMFTARRLVTPYAGTSQSTGSQRIVTEPKQDSLTTLKMALSRSKALTATSLSPVSTTTTTTVTPGPPLGQLIAVQSTRLPFSSGAQSRWIPSTVYVTRPPASTTSKPMHTSRTTPSKRIVSSSTTTSTTTTTTTPTPTTTTARIATTKTTPPMTTTTARTTVSPSDLNELRASDTISRYTTHLIGEANELIATTRRHFPQQLPQIANTGDFFSSETIASWPDKYHTMLSQGATESHLHYDSSPSRPTTSSSFATSAAAVAVGSSETTRRNGDAYELIPAVSSALIMASTPADQISLASSTLARHRLDDATTAQTGSSEAAAQSVAYIITNSPGITILPANHKLTPSTAQQEQNGSHHQGGDTGGSAYTSPMETLHETSTEWPAAHSTAAVTQTKQSSAPYTLMDQSMMTATSSAPMDSEDSRTTRLMAQLTSLMTPGQLEAVVNETNRQIMTINGSLAALNTSDLLRPPYRELAYDQEPAAAAASGDIELDASQTQPQVYKKLYGIPSASYSLSSPPAQSFVAQRNQNSQTRQRFNWSVLKYLAQNLLANSPLINRFNGTTTTTTNITQIPIDMRDQQQWQYNQAQEVGDVGEETNGEGNVSNNSTQQRLLDLMTRTGFPSNYYELLAANNTNDDDSEQQFAMTTGTNVSHNSSGKGIFERAGNLLQEMKQLEQKKAAALLAAFRYQVPGPLVRPWDMNSDYLQQLQGRAGGSISRFFSDRLDDHAGKQQQQLPTGQLLNTIKSTLFKQKFIARDELEARLNAGKAKRFSLDRSDEAHGYDNNDNNITLLYNTRRSDTLLDTNVNSLVDSRETNDTKTQLDEDDQLRYLVLATDNNQTDGRNSSGLATIFHSLSLPLNNLTSDRPVETQARDFDSINLSAESHQDLKSKQQQVVSSEVIHKLRSSSSSATASKSTTPSSMSNNRQNYNNRQVMVGLSKSTPSSTIRKGDDKARRKIQDDSDDEVIALPNSFDCTGKMAGFYPDAGSSCRVLNRCQSVATFYHCSNTGHVLTFECPTQTRFDEKSLKCGPWYEVPCDVNRIRLGYS